MEYKFSKSGTVFEALRDPGNFQVRGGPGGDFPVRGNPSPEAFPTKAIEEITASILEKNPIAALQYSITEGYALAGNPEGLHEKDS